MLEEEYAPFQKKYGLPKFSEIENEFELLTADSEYPLKEILKKIAEKLDFLSELLSNVIQPAPESMGQMLECEALAEEQKEPIMEIFKEVNFLVRTIHESQLENDEKKTADVIRDTFSAWPSLKKKMLPLMRKLRESWKSEIKSEEIVGYFG